MPGINNYHQRTYILGIRIAMPLISIFGGYVKVKESLYTQFIMCINTILDHMDTREILPMYECYYMVYKSTILKKMSYTHTLVLVSKNVNSLL